MRFARVGLSMTSDRIAGGEWLLLERSGVRERSQSVRQEQESTGARFNPLSVTCCSRGG